MGVFVVAILWLGVAPGPVLQRVEQASRNVVEAARFGVNAPAAALHSPRRADPWAISYLPPPCSRHWRRSSC